MKDMDMACLTLKEQVKALKQRYSLKHTDNFVFPSASLVVKLKYDQIHPPFIKYNKALKKKKDSPTSTSYTTEVFLPQ